MTPDTAALRALADRADDDSSAPVVTLDTDTVRALCDAADEVERLRAEVNRRKAETDRAVRERNALSESHAEWEQRARTAESLARGMERGRGAVMAERDAARASLDAVLALCDDADEAHKAYLAGIILDRFIMPSNVTTERVRAAITDALGGGT